MAGSAGGLVGSHELAPALQQRLKDALGSYEELQVLLYARGQAAPWSAADAVRRLHLEERTLTEALESLQRSGFVTATEAASPADRRFTYRPSSPLLAELADRLSDALERNPLHVFDLMNRHALERLRSSAARTFASAFVLGRKKDG
jgi:DNA-binding MarR family transcriptional regulator